ncbi:MAG TPA: hypothetical protein VK869_06305 [Rubrobacteraceae bacterium]|nr:hypothetical protein [Rubrobacteraceae bacterium]
MSAPEPLAPDGDERSSGAPGMAPAAVGARAAGLLSGACRPVGGASSLRLEVVRCLALSIERELDAVARSAAEDATPDLLVEAALRCADLATLAACNAGPALPEAGTVVRRAAVAARDLRSLAESRSIRLENEHAESLRRDARGVGWRVDLASRQVEGS